MPTEERALEFMQAFGLTEAARGFVSCYEALCIFTAGGSGSPLELIVPTNGKLAQFNRGLGGLHHIAMCVQSLSQWTAELAARGVSLLEEQPVKGAGPFYCNFLHPVFSGGIIMEFVEEIEESADVG